MHLSLNRVLVAIPAYNEQATIEGIIRETRESVPGFEILVINDGSHDSTAQILKTLGVISATHLSNLGYGRAIQTAIKYAQRANFDVLITMDADGQHHPEQIPAVYQASLDSGCDVLIGSRYLRARDYPGVPLERQIGMRWFSLLVKMITGNWIYDTTSGLKVINRSVFEPLIRWQFLDFHAEAIVHLARLGYQLGEYPITATERAQGKSMYSFFSLFEYPLSTSMLVLLGVIEAELRQRRSKMATRSVLGP